MFKNSKRKRHLTLTDEELEREDQMKIINNNPPPIDHIFFSEIQKLNLKPNSVNLLLDTFKKMDQEDKNIFFDKIFPLESSNRLDDSEMTESVGSKNHLFLERLIHNPAAIKFAEVIYELKLDNDQKQLFQKKFQELNRAEQQDLVSSKYFEKYPKKINEVNGEDRDHKITHFLNGILIFSKVYDKKLKPEGIQYNDLSKRKSKL
ncbi:hypothetical protein OAC51_03055 [Flavobacteriaceae bacterium]|nr:hypothetical protein [Flavobacteriaceae bacterium]